MRTGIALFFFYKVSLMKHPNEHISKLWLLKNDFFICMDTKHGKRAHKRFLTDELGPENENNLQIGKVTWGHKYLRFCLKSSLEFFLSLPLTFPMYLIIYQHPKYHQRTGNMTFQLLTSKIDVLPISQDFPWSYREKSNFEMHRLIPRDKNNIHSTYHECKMCPWFSHFPPWICCHFQHALFFFFGFFGLLWSNGGKFAMGEDIVAKKNQDSLNEKLIGLKRSFWEVFIFDNPF